MSDQPTNAELLQSFKDHADEDHRFQLEARSFNGEMASFKAETEGKLAKLDHMPTKDEISVLVEAAMVNALKSKGKAAYGGLLIVAGIVGALAVIGGGAKALLAWIGFAYLK